MKFRSWLLAALLASAGPAVAQAPGSGPGAFPASSGDVAATTSTATLASGGSFTWWVTGVEVLGNYATAQSIVVCTITGMVNGDVTIDVPVATNAGIGAFAPFVVSWNPPISGVPGSAVVFSCPSFGAGATHSAITIHATLQ
jgi:hypothetical protein